MKTQVKTLEFEDVKSNQDTATVFLGMDKIGQIGYLGAQDENGADLLSGWFFDCPMQDLEEVKAPTRDKCKVLLQAQMEAWWAEQVERFTELVDFAPVLVAGPPKDS